LYRPAPDHATRGDRRYWLIQMMRLIQAISCESSAMSG
jgi:hypothetical protein